MNGAPEGKCGPIAATSCEMSGSSLGRLAPVKLRDVWKSESSDFTPWLALETNITLLGEAIGLELIVEAQEKNVGPFRADILCKDTASSNWVLIENQLERTDHSHLGQLLTYAAGLHAVTIVWIAERFTDEHRAALDWLNEVTGEGISFFGLEIELWKIGDSPAAPKFNVISQPNGWTKTVSDARDHAGELSEAQNRNFRFWKSFGDRIDELGSPIRKLKPGTDQWKNYALGRSGFQLTAYINGRDKRIGIIVVINHVERKRDFDRLFQRRSEIETAIGSPLVWDERPNLKDCQIRLTRADCDPTDETLWKDQQNWLIEKLVLFKKVFIPIIKSFD